MSKDWVYDLEVMHEHYGATQAVSSFDREKLKALLQFRIDFLKEELNELDTAETAEDVVDALIDLCVVAIGTLDLFEVNSHRAWEEVLTANMNKEPGIKPERPNPLGLPDLIKPEGWTPPSHEGNHGRLWEVFKPVCEV